jgi:hypothetical protein
MEIAKKIGKVVLYIILGIFILLIVISLFIDPIAKRFLENQVAKADEGQYSLRLDEVDISLLRGNFRMHGLRFETDTAHHETPPIAFVTANEIAAEGVSWLTFLLEEKLLLDEIRLDQLEVALYARQSLAETEEEEEDPSPFRLRNLDIYPALKDQVDRLRLRDLTLNDISLTLANVTTQDTLNFNARELRADSDDILIDADKLFTDNRAFYATYINFEGEDISVAISGNRSLEYETGFLRFNTDEEMMKILVQELRFMESGIQRQDTMMYAALENFSLTNLDMQRLQEERTGYIENIRLTGFDLVNNHAPAPDTLEDEQQIDFAELSFGAEMPEVMDRLELEELDIQHVSLRQRNMLTMEDFNLHAFKMVVDETPAFAQNRFLHAQEMESSLEHLALSMGATNEPMLHINLAGLAMEVQEGVGNIGFQELQVNPGEKPDDEFWFEARIGPLNVFRLDTRQLIDRQLSVDSIAIETPQILAHMAAQEQEMPRERPQQEQEAMAPDLYPAIADFLNSFRLGKLAVIGADIELSGMEGFEEKVRFPAMYMQLRDVLIAEGTAFEGKRVLHSEDIAFRVEDIDLTLPDDIYHLKFDFARFSTFEKFFEVGGFTYNYGDQKKQDILEDIAGNMLMSVKNKHFRIDNLNFQELIKNQAFLAEDIQAEGLELYVFVDEHFPLEEEVEKTAEEAAGPEGATKMPQEMLKHLDIPIYLGSLDLSSGHIIYEELLEGADTAGVMELTEFFLKADNITNQQNRLQENGDMILRAGAKVMDDGKFQTEMVFDMDSDANEVLISGTVDSLDLTTLNRFTTYTSRLALSSGQLHTLNWDIKADEENASGKMEMAYEDLNIRISEGVGSDTTGVLKDIGAFLANKLVLESDVPAEDPEEPEVVEVEAEKEEEQGFIDYYVETLVDGLLDLMLTISFLL